ncbi:MAG: baseplate J/gp47 family protein [Flavobacteriales bacterium]|jgi:phage-related baseplate assembly protein
MAGAPKFVENNPDVIVQQMVADYESRTGKTLQPAQIERLLINAFAYRESLLRAAIQYAAEQNLVKFANAPALDRLGDLVGVSRLAPAPAECTIQFTLVSVHPQIVIPEGTRVSTRDGRIIFSTKFPLTVPANVTTATVAAVADLDGVIGNGYIVGDVRDILDPQAFVTAATNTTVTAGGENEESDEALRERIILAPGSFSNAGSREAYIYWARTASASIVDVAVTNPVPGTVEIFPLMANGSVTPPEILAAVEEICSDEKIRPLTDTVNVTAPTRVNFTLTVNLTLYTTAIQPDVVAAVNAALTEFLALKRGKLGQDVLITQLTRVCMVDGVYNVAFPGFSDQIITPTQFAFATAVTVNFVGTSNG